MTLTNSEAQLWQRVLWVPLCLRPQNRLTTSNPCKSILKENPSIWDCVLSAGRSLCQQKWKQSMTPCFPFRGGILSSRCLCCKCFVCDPFVPCGWYLNGSQFYPCSLLWMTDVQIIFEKELFICESCKLMLLNFVNQCCLTELICWHLHQMCSSDIFDILGDFNYCQMSLHFPRQNAFSLVIKCRVIY